MHIAFFTETYFPQINGVTYTIDNWRTELERRGHTVSIIYPENGYREHGYEYPVPSIDFKPVDGYKVGLSFISDLVDRLPDEPVDIVHAHSQFSLGILGAWFARNRDVPFVVSYHTPGEQYFDYVSRNRLVQDAMDVLYLGWERLFYRRCNLILAPTEQASNRLEARIGRPVTPLSNGIDTRFFAPASDDAVAAFRDRHGIPADTPVIGYCGRLGYEKNLEDLARLADRFDGEIVVAGEGFAEEYYLPLFEEAGVRYIGCLDRAEMPLFYAMLDVFVIPSTAETQGVSVLEANACGTPAVGADAQALRETIRDGRNGYRYPVGDIAVLAERVATARETGMEKDARSVAKEHSIRTVIDTLEASYGDIAENDRALLQSV